MATLPEKVARILSDGRGHSVLVVREDGAMTYYIDGERV